MGLFDNKTTEPSYCGLCRKGFKRNHKRQLQFKEEEILGDIEIYLAEEMEEGKNGE